MREKNQIDLGSVTFWETEKDADFWRDCFTPNDVVVYDVKLRKFLKNRLALGFWIPVEGGESLKTFSGIESLLKKVFKVASQIPKNQLRLIAMGGGSLGDTVGFIAHIFKRGVPWVVVPSTWLAAADSAHGGKTALNFQGWKNQLGAYHFPKEVHIVESLLKSQPSARSKEAMGEVVKMALLIPETKLLLKLRTLGKSMTDLGERSLLWQLLPVVVESKRSIVRQDPFEAKNIRHGLNLGHTLGHILEAKLKLPHGLAVYQGLVLDLSLAKQKKLLKDPKLFPIEFRQNIQSNLKKIKWSAGIFTSDKKIVGKNEILIPILEKPGVWTVESTPVASLVRELNSLKETLC